MSDITESEAQEILRSMSEGKQNVHTFFRDIIQADDTTKTGNLTQDELGLPKLPVRTLKELQLYCKSIYQDKGWADYFSQMSEIQTSTSLSKDAILLKLSVTQKKELADTTPKQEKKKNKGWFKAKDGGNVSDY